MNNVEAIARIVGVKPVEGLAVVGRGELCLRGRDNMHRGLAASPMLCVSPLRLTAPPEGAPNFADEESEARGAYVTRPGTHRCVLSTWGFPEDST